MISYVLKLIRTGTIIVYIFSFIAIVLSIFLYYDGMMARNPENKSVVIIEKYR